MFDIGFTEMMLIGIIALVVLGPERLPMVARKVGKFLGNSRRMFFKFQQEIMKETSVIDTELKTHLSEFEQSVKDTEKKMHKVFSLEQDDDELSDGHEGEE